MEQKSESDNNSPVPNRLEFAGESCYERALAVARKTHKNPFTYDPKSSELPSLGSHIIGLFSGETPQERLARQRFEAYKNYILEEAKIAEIATTQHNVHRKSLIIDFSEQATQLQRWGLTHVLPFFRIQAWVRISRTLILEEIASLSRTYLMERADAVSEAIQMSSIAGLANKQSFLSSRLDNSCLMPDVLISSAPEIMSLQYRLLKMDNICQVTLRKFKLMLPEVEAKSHTERRDILIRILSKYKTLNENIYPEGIDTMTWDEFTAWYQQHHRDMRDLERGFGNFVEDDREKEGRLFRRWCTLANTSSGDDIELIGAERVVDKDAEEERREGLVHSTHESSPQRLKSGAEGSPPKALMKLKLSPRTISAFTKYFSKQVMVAKYKCPADLVDTLVSITESIVFRRITAVTFSYPNKALQQRDIKFRLKCLQCRSVDPTKFGVLSRYICKMTSEQDDSNQTLKDLQSPEITSSFEPSLCRGCLACSNLSLNYRLNSDRVVGDTHTCLRPRDGGYVRKSKSTTLESLYSTPYFRSSKLMSFMSSSVCPKDIVFNLLLGIKWLLRDAVLQSGKSEFLGADLMFPILVLVLVHANLPTMHLILHFLKSFSAVDNYGEAAYYVTCLEAAVLFIDRFEVPLELKPRVEDSNDPFAGLPLASTSGIASIDTVANGCGIDEKHPRDVDDSGSFSYTDLNSDEELSRDDIDSEFADGEKEDQEGDNTSPKDDEKAIKKLGEWIRDQHTMEETITILQQQGWMV